VDEKGGGERGRDGETGRTKTEIKQNEDSSAVAFVLVVVVVVVVVVIAVVAGRRFASPGGRKVGHLGEESVKA
jgi:cobalamin biosynthesis Mg chelatase CobN